MATNKIKETELKSTFTNTESLLSTTSTTPKDFSYDFDIVMDDSLFGSRTIYEKLHNIDEKENLFPLLIISVVFITLIFIIVNIAYLISFKKYKKSAIYELLTYLFVFKFGFCLIETLNILSSTYFENSDFHLKPVGFLCFMTKFFTLFIELNQNFFMILIWIILLSERNLIGFQFLYSDYDLINQSFNNPIASNDLNMSSTNDSQRLNDQITRLREKTFKNFLIKNSRAILTWSFILFSFLLSLYFNRNVTANYFGSYSFCVLSNYFDSSILKFLYSLTLVIYFMPIFYWLILLPIFFSSLFGGSRDPNLSKLEQSDLNLIKFIKVASVLKSFDELLLHLFTTHYWSISFGIYEFSRLFGLLIILLTNILFFYYGNIYLAFKRSFFTSRDLAGNNRSIFNNRNRMSEEQSNRDDSIDYRNLVENA